MKQCWFCHEEIPDQAIVCPYCGRRDPKAESRKVPQQEKPPVNKSQGRARTSSKQQNSFFDTLRRKVRYRLWDIYDRIRVSMPNRNARAIWLIVGVVIAFVAVVVGVFALGPLMTYNQAQAAEKAGDFKQAISSYQDIIDSASFHPIALQARLGLARALLADAKQSGAGVIDPPDRIGTTGGSNADVVIANGSPERLQIVFSGPETTIEQLPPCQACNSDKTNSSSVCSDNGIYQTFHIQAGDYGIIVEALGKQMIKSWTGTWTIASGVKYSAGCFYIDETTIP